MAGLSRRALSRAALILAVVLHLSCDSESSSSPTAPLAPGQLRFVSNGCACTKPPYPGIPIYVDGQQAGVLPVFGELKLTMTAGPHVWSTEASGATTSVQVHSGGTTTVRIFTNFNCPDGCTEPT